jgi:glycosyltransferase involved in cell wall biosynthesis
MKTVVAYSTAPWNHALAVLRLVAPLREAGIRLIHGHIDGDIHPEKVADADLVVVQRDFPMHLRPYEQITELARRQSKPIVLDLDDWLLSLPENHPDRISHHYAAGLFPLMRALIEADAVTASTYPLCEQLLKLNPNTWVLPNYLDSAVWQPRPATYRPPGDAVTLVYMGGNTHTPDLEPLIPILAELLSQYGSRLTLHVAGMQPDKRLRDFPNVVYTPFLMDYADYARFAANHRFDVAIAPLADNLFNRCKSAIKYLEYSILGIPGVYSAISPYADLVQPYENGLLATTPQDWMQAITCLVEDAQLREHVGKSAQAMVQRQWTLRDHAHEWLDAYRKIAERGASPQLSPTVPARLVVDLTRQTQLWMDALQSASQRVSEQNGAQPGMPISSDQGASRLNSSPGGAGSAAARHSRWIEWLITAAKRIAPR